MINLAEITREQAEQVGRVMKEYKRDGRGEDWLVMSLWSIVQKTQENAQSDDLAETLGRQRDVLLEKIIETAKDLDIINKDASPNGAECLMLLDDIKTKVERPHGGRLDIDAQLGALRDNWYARFGLYEGEMVGVPYRKIIRQALGDLRPHLEQWAKKTKKAEAESESWKSRANVLNNEKGWERRAKEKAEAKVARLGGLLREVNEGDFDINIELSRAIEKELGTETDRE